MLKLCGRSVFPFALAVVVTLLLGRFAEAQLPTATILGVVKDASGATIPGANVTVTNRETGAQRSAQTGQDGHYQFPSLPVGVYDLKAEAPSFKPETQQNLNLAVGQNAVINFSLIVGAVEETVTVAASAPLVDTTSGSLGGLVNEQRVADLPLNGRNFADLMLLQTGISQMHTYNTTASVANGDVISSNGATIHSNYVTLDGASMNGAQGFNPSGVSGATLGIEGIREFRIITNFFPAECGMVMGSQTVIVSKGGTNQLHGSVLEFLRNSDLDARNFFDTKLNPTSPRIPAFRRNQFGGSVGGPIRKNNTFFFLGYEGIRQSLGATQVLSVPTLAARQNGGLVSVVNPSVQPYLAQMPLPTQPLPTDLTGASGVGRYTYVFNEPTSENWAQARIDQNFSEKDNLFVRYTIDDTARTEPAGGSYPDWQDLQASRNQFLTLAENHIFSPSLLNVSRLSYSRPYQSYLSPSSTALGFLPGLQEGNISPGSGISTLGPMSTRPSAFDESLFTLSDDLSWIRDKHTLKFGTLMNRFQEYSNSGTGLRGSYTFSNLQQFLLGNPLSYSIDAPGSYLQRAFRWYTFGFYAQDDWRITSRFTVNVGLRYEFNTTVNETSGHGSSLRDAISGSAFTIAPAVYQNPSLHNFSPRLGFAWDVFGDQSTSLRGGFGLLYDIATVVPAAQIVASGTPPFGNSVTLTSGLGFPYTVVPPLTQNAIRMVDWHLQQPHMIVDNLVLDRALPGNMMFSVAYSGSRGMNIYETKEGNTTYPVAVIDGRQYWAPNEPRLNPNFGQNELHTASGDSWYNAMEVTVQKRLSHGLQFQSSYTWSHSLDDTQSLVPAEVGGSGTEGVDPINGHGDKGNSDFDLRHQWVFNTMYQVPSPNLRGAGAILNGWRLGSIFSVKSGEPFTVLLSGNRSNSLVLTTNPDRPDVAPGCNPGNIVTGNPNQYFKPSCFTIQPAGFLGYESRGYLTGPGLVNLDFSMTKDTNLSFWGEGRVLEFRAEAFNLLNRANFYYPSGRTVFTATGTTASTTPVATAGNITMTETTSRQLQFALKLIF